MESEDTHLIRHVKLARPVEVEDGVEGPRVAVKEVLVVEEGVVGAQVHDGSMGVGLAQAAKARVGELLQHPPHHLVPVKRHLSSVLCF